MKTTIALCSAVALGLSMTVSAQVTAPQPSPLAKVEQKVGLTDVTINYSRPNKKGRTIFGDLVPYNEVWRTGANENTKITLSDVAIFGKDTLKAGTYAIFTKPGKDSWDVYFYTDYSNWGTPEKWDDAKVAVKVSVKPTAIGETAESFTIGVDDVDVNGAKLNISWDKTRISVPFAVASDAKVMASIKKTMAGPSANDYNSAANYYLTTKKDLKQALDWSNKAVEMRPEAYWMMRTKSLIQAELGDKAGAIATAKLGVVAAEKGENPDYVKMFNTSIADWSKK